MISISFQAAKMVFGAILANLSQIGKVHDTGGVEFWREPARAEASAEARRARGIDDDAR